MRAFLIKLFEQLLDSLDGAYNVRKLTWFDDKIYKCFNKTKNCRFIDCRMEQCIASDQNVPKN